MTVFAAAAANACFLAGYVFYLLQAGSLSPEAPVKMAYLVPAAVYALLLGFSLLESRATGRKFTACAAGLSPALFVFTALFITPFFVKISLPQPHDFMLRKLELILGASYTLFIFSISAFLLFRIRKAVEIKKLKESGVFQFIFVFFFVFYCALALWFGHANEPTGDEPAYIMAAHSMLHDRDLDMKNNFENKDYRRFYSRDLQPQGNNLNVNGKMYPKHPVLLSVIIAPFYLAAGVAGISVLMCFFSALLAALLFLISNKISGNLESSAAAAVMAGITLPAVIFINISSTDVLCGLIPAAAFFLYRFKPDKVISFSIVMAFAVWIHLRIAPVYAVLALLFIIMHRRKPADVIKFILVQAASFSLYFGINLYFYHDLIPYSSYQTGGMRYGWYLIRGLFAYFFDRQLGLFSYTPFYILMLPGLYFLYKKSRSIAVEFALVFIPYYLIIAAYSEWGWGSSSARYLMAVLFIITAAVAESLAAVKNAAAKTALYILGAASICLSLIVSAVPWFRWDRAGHENWIIYIFNKFTGIDLNVIFPSIINADKNTVIGLVFWILFASAVTGIIIHEVTAGKGRINR